MIGQTNERKNYKYGNVISALEVCVATGGWQIIQQKHQPEFVLFPNCSGSIVWQVLSEKGLQRALVWQGVSVLVFSSVHFLPDTRCSEAHAPEFTITNWYETKGCGSSGVRFALILHSKKEVEPHEGWLAISLHVSAAYRVSQILVLILLAIHTVNTKRRCRKTKDSIRAAQSLVYGELMIGRPTLMSERREILSHSGANSHLHCIAETWTMSELIAPTHVGRHEQWLTVNIFRLST